MATIDIGGRVGRRLAEAVPPGVRIPIYAHVPGCGPIRIGWLSVPAPAGR